MDYKDKYLKYKAKYLALKEQTGSGSGPIKTVGELLKKIDKVNSNIRNDVNKGIKVKYQKLWSSGQVCCIGDLEADNYSNINLHRFYHLMRHQKLHIVLQSANNQVHHPFV